jgi:hypothetical protein
MSGKTEGKIFCIKLKLFTYFVIQSALKHTYRRGAPACIHCNTLTVMQLADRLSVYLLPVVALSGYHGTRPDGSVIFCTLQ